MKITFFFTKIKKANLNRKQLNIYYFHFNRMMTSNLEIVPLDESQELVHFSKSQLNLQSLLGRDLN